MNIFLLYLGVIPTVIFFPYRTISTRSYKQGYLLAVYCLLCYVEWKLLSVDFAVGFPYFCRAEFRRQHIWLSSLPDDDGKLQDYG